MSLPQQIPPQTVPWGKLDPDGNVIVDVNWYLFLYNLATQVFTQGKGSIPVTNGDLLGLLENDEIDVDAVIGQKLALNALIQSADGLLADPNGVDVARAALVQATDILLADGRPQEVAQIALLQAFEMLLSDSVPRAQPSASVTVGASPWTYTALQDGILVLSANSATSISIVRQGVSVASGIQIGPISLRRLDQAVVTYAAAPTAVFLPN